MMGRKGRAYERLENSPFRKEYIEMRKKGYTQRQIYEYYLEKEGELDKEKGMKPVSFGTFRRWLSNQDIYVVADSGITTDLTKIALDIIERDREILNQLDDNLLLLKGLSNSLSKTIESGEFGREETRTLVEVLREMRQTIQTMMDLRNKLKSLGMVSPKLVRDALVECLATLPPDERKVVLAKFDEVIQRIVTMKVWKGGIETAQA